AAPGRGGPHLRGGPHPCGGARLRSGRGLPGGGPGHSGHDASTSSQASWEVLSPFTHSTIAVQKLPPPTGPGIRSEPSKRNTSALEAISATLRVVSSAYWEESKVWWGLSHPPACAQSFVVESRHHLAGLVVVRGQQGRQGASAQQGHPAEAALPRGQGEHADGLVQFRLHVLGEEARDEVALAVQHRPGRILEQRQ